MIGQKNMKIGVTHKLFLSILMAAGLAVISSVLIMQWSINRGFLRYVNTIEKSGISRLANRLENCYRTERSWDFLRRDPAQWRQLVFASLPMEEHPPRERMPPPPEAMPNEAPPERPKDNKPPHHDGLLPPHLARQFDERLFLLDADKKIVISRVEVPDNSETTSLRYNGKVVGYLGILPNTQLSSDAPQKRFLREQELAFALTAGVVVLLASALSLLLATRLVRPLSELARATHQLAAGTFSVRVPITSNDELGQLANDFNSLALALEKNEEARRQWVADISHELRTPLAILRGEIEALQDGIRQPTPQTIQSLHGEVLRLGRLVDDLYQLSLSDVGALTYRKTELDLGEVLCETVEAFRPEFMTKSISLVENISKDTAATFFGDPQRLHQLFSNLLDNALKYTDSGGKLLVKLDYCDGGVAIDFQDSAPGVPPTELNKLFDRLYRVDSSRNRSTGGAGLGLAICRNIVEAHAGTITARPSPLGGLWVGMEFSKKGSM
jgi:two-component system, OmpR family, sensor histidine kinase BaeS